MHRKVAIRLENQARILYLYMMIESTSISIEIRSGICFLSTERDLFDAGCFCIHPAPRKVHSDLTGSANSRASVRVIG